MTSTLTRTENRKQQHRFLSAKSLDAAKEFIHELEPRTAWFVIPKEYCDKNIVYAEIER